MRRRSYFLTATYVNRMLTAAGVTPLIRDAWPIDRGRIWRELLDDLARQPGDAARSRAPSGSATASARCELGGVDLLAAQVAVVDELDRDALERGRRRVGRARGRRRPRRARPRASRARGGARARPSVARRSAIGARAVARELGVDRVGAGDARALGARAHALRARRVHVLERAPARVVDEPEPAAERHQALVGVVLAQQQAVLGARGHHAVGLVGALGDEVVDEHAGVGLVAAQEQRLRRRRHGRAPALMPASRPWTAASS